MQRRTDLITPVAKLRDAVDTLEAAWADASTAWRDDVARRFHEQHLAYACPPGDAALGPIERLS